MVEWNTDPRNIYTFNTANNFTVNLPSLIYNEYVTPDFQELKKEPLKEPLVWSSIENDVVALPIITIIHICIFINLY